MVMTLYQNVQIILLCQRVFRLSASAWIMHQQGLGEERQQHRHQGLADPLYLILVIPDPC